MAAYSCLLLIIFPFGELLLLRKAKEKNQRRKNKMTKSVYEIITEKTVKKLENGVVP
jgi:hypothetical protein